MKIVPHKRKIVLAYRDNISVLSSEIPRSLLYFKLHVQNFNTKLLLDKPPIDYRDS